MNISNKKTVELVENRLVLVRSKGKEAGKIWKGGQEVLISLLYINFQF